jgi:hypothetical protein
LLRHYFADFSLLIAIFADAIFRFSLAFFDYYYAFHITPDFSILPLLRLIRHAFDIISFSPRQPFLSLPPAFRHYGHAHCHIIIDISLPH